MYEKNDILYIQFEHFSFELWPLFDEVARCEMAGKLTITNTGPECDWQASLGTCVG